MENNKNKKSVKFQGDMLNFCDFIQVFVFTRNHHLKEVKHYESKSPCTFDPPPNSTIPPTFAQALHIQMKLYMCSILPMGGNNLLLKEKCCWYSYFYPETAVSA